MQKICIPRPRLFDSVGIVGLRHSPALGLHRGQRTYAFTCVRNPYTRVLSSFFDKICGIQRNGKRYRGNLVPKLINEYGIEVGGEDGKQEFDQIQSFRRFLQFVRDSI